LTNDLINLASVELVAVSIPKQHFKRCGVRLVATPASGHVGQDVERLAGGSVAAVNQPSKGAKTARTFRAFTEAFGALKGLVNFPFFGEMLAVKEGSCIINGRYAACSFISCSVVAVFELFDFLSTSKDVFISISRD
jgi:hypothetical protein